MRNRAFLYLVVFIVILLLAGIALLLTMTLTAPRIGNVFSSVVSALTSPTSAALLPTATPLRAPRTTATPAPQSQRPPAQTAVLPDVLLTPSGGGGAPEPGAAAPSDSETGSTAVENSPTPVETAVKVADATLLIRSKVSGEIIGDGTVLIFAPSAARYPESALVRLELNLDNFYITPTPAGARGTPVPRATSAATGVPTLGAPLITDSGVSIYERMGASLFCSERSFDGCDQTYDLNRAKLITTRHTTWEWTVFPKQDVTGTLNLRAELWISQLNLDGQPEIVALEGTQYTFQIRVNQPTGMFPIWIPLGAAVVIAALAAGFVIARRRAVPAAVPPAAATGKKPLVFISYRRGSSWAQARSIAQSLQQRGANVFIDVDDINEGRFAEIIEKTINNCDYFVPILMPETLESEWVRREIRYALACDKIIIPLLAGGFTLEPGVLPDDIKDIASHNAITLLPEFYEEAINRLAERFLKLKD